MATLDDDERALIEKDREENPGAFPPAVAGICLAPQASKGSSLVVDRSFSVAGCFYSTALSQSCRSINGESKCEIIKKIFRQCPGKNKVLCAVTSIARRISHSGWPY
jgi:hypothetical protein